MGKYEPLTSFLLTRKAQEIPMSFKEIEDLIRASLPPVAFKHRAWWSNNASNSVMTRAWLDAGFRTERVDMTGQKLVFRRASSESGPQPPQAPSPHRDRIPTDKIRRQGRHPAWGALKGTMRVAPGVDLTEPLHEPWGGEEW